MDMGLGYIHLNQALSTLSGGELQRLKMASYLGENGKIFIIDEPTDGLHPKDIHRLIDLFNQMVENEQEKREVRSSSQVHLNKCFKVRIPSQQSICEIQSNR